MPLQTNFNVSPFYDDYNANNNYHRILFRPGIALQARELTQLQTILQNQIERFGDNIFVEGTIIQGCTFNYDPNYYYVKLPDLMVNGAPTLASAYVGWTAVDPASNLQAIVINSRIGYETQAPFLNTIYVKYINSGVYANGTQVQQFANNTILKFYAGSYNSGNTANYQSFYDTALAGDQNGQLNGVDVFPTGTGYAFSVSDGIIFQKGHFVRVPNNTSVVVSAYTNYPNNVSVGFVTDENIITELNDQSLLDNAAGYTNANAPGAWRLQLMPRLVVSQTDTIPANNFLSLVRFEDGNAVKVNQTTQYNVLGDELARREYETSGDFVVNPFTVSTEQYTTNTSYFKAVVSSGLAYIDGYRVEQKNSSRLGVRKGLDTKTLNGQTASTRYGNYVRANEFVGQFKIGSKVYLYDTATQALTNDIFAPNPTGNVIGTATVISLAYETGVIDTNTAIYDIYLKDITMNSGRNFTDVRSVFANTSGGANTALADLVLEYNITKQANVAVIKDATFSSLVFPTGKAAVQTIQSNALFVYKTSSTVQFNTSGLANLPILTSGKIYDYGVGTLSAAEEASIIIVPYNTTNVSTTTGTASTNTSSNQVNGSGTSFLSQYQIGDYIIVGNDYRRITNIANNTALFVDSNWPAINSGQSHNKCYPAYIPINITDRNSIVTLANSTSMSVQLKSAAGSAETFAVGPNTEIYYNVSQQTGATPKTVNTTIVCIDTAYNLALNGTVNVSSTSASVTGANTKFSSYILPGYKLYLANNNSNSAFIGTVANVANDTALTLTSNASYTGTNQNIIYSANNSRGPAGPWPLGFPDAYNLLAVYRTSANQGFTVSPEYNVSGSFAIQTNQTDTTYNISNLILSPTSSLQLNNGDKLTVVYRVFRPTSTQPGFFTVDSYPIDDANTANTIAITTDTIPTYTTSLGKTLALRDSIDFREYVSNTVPLFANLSQAVAASAGINPSDNTTLTAQAFVTPNQVFTYNVTYYLPRQDKIFLNGAGSLSIVEGISSDNPVPPADQPTSMTLATLSISPYPTLLPKFTSKNNITVPKVVSVSAQTRRYTMSDIDKLNKRITSLEYYSSLSLLEQSTTALNIQSSLTGLNVYKNGIFVDNFNDTTGANLTDKEYFVSRDATESSLIPAFEERIYDFMYDPNENNGNGLYAASGDLVTLPYNEAVLLTQQSATRTRNCTAGFYNWVGTLKTAPTYDNFIDVRVNSVVTTINNISNITNNTYNNITNITNDTTNNTYNNTTNNISNITNITQSAAASTSNPVSAGAANPGVVFPLPTKTGNNGIVSGGVTNNSGTPPTVPSGTAITTIVASPPILSTSVSDPSVDTTVGGYDITVPDSYTSYVPGDSGQGTTIDLNAIDSALAGLPDIASSVLDSIPSVNTPNTPTDTTPISVSSSTQGDIASLIDTVAIDSSSQITPTDTGSVSTSITTDPLAARLSDTNFNGPTNITYDTQTQGIDAEYNLDGGAIGFGGGGGEFLALGLDDMTKNY